MTLEGAIEARNERGLKLDGEWLNVSKFRPIPIPDVAAGTPVRVEVDGKGFLKSIELLEDELPAAPSSRDATITRLTVLKAAAHFAAGRDEVKSADVLRIAESWLCWIAQEDA